MSVLGFMNALFFTLLAIVLFMFSLSSIEAKGVNEMPNYNSPNLRLELNNVINYSQNSKGFIESSKLN